jgi:hypothetical protein
MALGKFTECHRAVIVSFAPGTQMEPVLLSRTGRLDIDHGVTVIFSLFDFTTPSFGSSEMGRDN